MKQLTSIAASLVVGVIMMSVFYVMVFGFILLFSFIYMDFDPFFELLSLYWFLLRVWMVGALLIAIMNFIECS